MAVTYLGSGGIAENTSAATTLNVPYPSGMTSSTMMRLVVSGSIGTLTTLPSGWTQVARFSNTGNTISPSILVAIKQATGSESGNLAVTTPSTISEGIIEAYNGVDLVTPQDVTATTLDQTTASNSSILPTLSPTMAGTAVCYAAALGSSVATATPPTSPATFTETMDRGTGTRAVTSGYLLWGSSGATGSVTVGWSGTGKSVGVLMVFRPSGATLSGAVDMTETSTLTVAGTTTGGGAVAMTETSSLTVVGTQTTSAAVAATATSTLTVAGTLPYTLHSYEEGTDTAAVASGVNDVVALIGAPTYATGSATHGSLGVHCGTNNAMLGYANPNAAGSSFQVYGKVGTLTLTSRNAFAKWTDSSGTTLGSISINASNVASPGAFTIIIGGVVYATSTVSVAAGDAFRVDAQMAWDGTNMAVTARLFLRSNVEGRTYDQQISATHTQASSPARIYYGLSVTASGVMSFDTLRLYPTLTWPGPYNPPIVPGTVTSTWSGDPLADGFVVVGHTLGATSLRLAVSTSSSMTSPVYVSAQSPNADGRTTHIVTGLAPATTYYYQLLDTPVGGTETAIGTPARTKTTPATGSPQAFTVALATCQLNNSTVSNAWDDIVTWDPTFVMHLGDLHYRAITSTDPSDHASGLATQIAAAAGLKSALAAVPVIYTNSDGEAGPNNGDSNTAWHAAFNTAYTTTVPARLVDTLPSPVGKYRTWVVGRIRFILVDDRTTDRSPGAAVDDASKTMLGATQKAWLKTQLLQPEPVKVICQNAPWAGTSTGFQWQDKWNSYQTERQELADFITTNRVQVTYWHGDAHFLGVDNGIHNAWGGFPMVDGSPLDNVGSTTNATFWQQTWGSSAPTSSYSQYQRISFTDDGVTITMSVSGWDALSNVERVSMVYTWSNVKAGAVAMTATSTLTVVGKRTAVAAVAMASTSLMTLQTSDPRTVGTITLRRNSAIGAAASNPKLLPGEPGFAEDGIRLGAIVGGSFWNDSPQTVMEGPGTLATITAGRSIDVLERVVICNGSTITVVMPAAGAALVGRRYVVKNIHSTTLTVTSGGGNIDGGASLTLAQWAKATLVSDGTRWLTI